MSKSNERRRNAFHEAGHCAMAWIEGTPIDEVRLVPDDEAGRHAATTGTVCPPPGQWKPKDVIAHMRITLAGPQADRFGPVPATTCEREFAKREAAQHQMQTVLFAKHFGETRMDDASIAKLAASAEQDVIAVFQRNYVIRCVDALARELLQRQSLSGPEVEAFIAGRISEEQRKALREECLLTRAERGHGREESGDRVTVPKEADADDRGDFPP
jgi:hypothetical protein